MKGRCALLAGGTAAFATVVLAGALLAHAAEDRGTTAAKNKLTKVRVVDNFFDPRSISVPEGEKVKFIWKGSNRHNVRFTKVPAGASRKGSKIKRNGRWIRTFGKPGVYRYVCTLFWRMRGTITVKPAPAGDG